MKNNIDETKFIKERGEICKNRDFIPLDLYKKYDERYVDKLIERNALEILQSIGR